MFHMPVVRVGKTTQPQLEQNFEAVVVVARQGQQAQVKLAVLGITPEQALAEVVVAAALMGGHLLQALREPQRLAAQAETERPVLVQVQAEPQQHWQP